MADVAAAHPPDGSTSGVPLRLRWFGGFGASWRGTSVTRLEAAPRAQALLLHTAVAAGEAVGRAELAAYLWPDVTDTQARTNLRQLLARCGKLVPSFETLLRVTTTSLAWRDEAPAVVDVLAFTTAARDADMARARGDDEALIAALTAAADVYVGELHVDLASAPLERARVRLHDTALRVFEELLDLHARAGRFGEATAYGDRLLEFEPLDEATCRRLMTLHAEAGAPRRGLVLFDRLRARLRDEVGAEPSVETVGLAALLEARAGIVMPHPAPRARRTRRGAGGDALSPALGAVLEALVVLGRDASIALVARVSGLTRREVADALDDLQRHGLAGVDAGGRIVVSERAAREADARLSPARRALLHGEAADALGHGSTRRRRHGTAVAVHLERAGRVLEAIHAYRSTAERALALASYDDARTAFEHALGLAGAGPAAVGGGAGTTVPAELLAALWGGLGACHARRLDGGAARRAFHEAARHVEGDVVTLATLAHQRAETYVSERALDEALAELDVADTLLATARRRAGPWHRAAIDVAALRARILYLMPGADGVAVDALLARLDDAVARHGTLAQRLEGDQAVLRFAVRRERYRLSAATLARAERAARTAEATGDALTVADGRFGAAFATLFASGPEPALPLLREALEQAERCGHRLLTVQSRSYLSLALRLAKRPEEARAMQGDLEASVDDATPLYGGLAAAQRGWLALLDGDVGSARTFGEQAVALWGSRLYPFRWSALLTLVAVAERPDEAGSWAEAMLGDDQQELPERLTNALRELCAAERALPARTRVVEAARALGYL